MTVLHRCRLFLGSRLFLPLHRPHEVRRIGIGEDLFKETGGLPGSFCRGLIRAAGYAGRSVAGSGNGNAGQPMR
jgi:hypothetical protein